MKRQLESSESRNPGASQRKGFLLVLACVIIFLPTSALALPGTDARQLAREAIQNEVQAEANNHALWCYRKLQKQGGKDLLYEYCETKDGTLHRLLAVNGHPLSPHERQAEYARIQKLVRSPGALREAQKKESADAEQERRSLRLFPEVFLFQEEVRHGDLAKLRFTPNPNYHPSGNMARILHSLQGTMVVNVKQHRLVSINGRLTSEVKFWGGLVGRLNPGGTFSVSMQNVAPGDWELKSLDIDMRGKALLFKTIGVHQHEAYSDYTSTPSDANLERAAKILQKDSGVEVADR